MSEIGSMEDFLSHTSTDRGGDRLGNWKKQKKVNVFLHRKVLPLPVWRHKFPKVVVRDENGESVRRVWDGQYVCCEDEKVLKKQYKRDDGGNRLVPPERCPICKMIEAVRDLVDEGKLSWTAPVFRFESDHDNESCVLHAGGLYNAYDNRNNQLSKEEVKELRDAGIVMSEAWQENAQAKMNYIFAVVNADKQGDGLLVSVETSLLGDKVKDVISDKIASLGRDKGNPQISPYCIQWEYDDAKGIPFNNRYKARPMDLITLTPEVDALISGPAPDLSNYRMPPVSADLRARMEKACVPEVRKLLPWDSIFGNAPAAPPEKAEARKPLEENRRDAVKAGAPLLEGDACPKCKNPIGSEACDHFELCAACDKPIMVGDAECPHCGKVYAAVPAEPEKPEPKPDPEPAAGRRGRRTTSKGDVPF